MVGGRDTVTLIELPITEAERSALWGIPPNPYETRQVDLRSNIALFQVRSLTLSNGDWILIDESLQGKKYLVMASASTETANPTAYQIVISGGKLPSGPVGIGFSFEPMTK